jgi:hypothetical protein
MKIGKIGKKLVKNFKKVAKSRKTRRVVGTAAKIVVPMMISDFKRIHEDCETWAETM